jgi:phosphatidylcholine synthase
MPARFAATLVHVFTALGAACALLATLALIRGDWRMMFAWLGVALIIDALDGPLARRAHVKTVLPRFDGERLDLVIDYLTYVFIPALALVRAGYLPGRAGELMAVAILMSSLFHFSDTQSKTDDNCFVGFPAVWNVVAFYLFAFAAPPWVALAVSAICVVLTFLPLKWVHPVRVVALRPVTAVLSLLWAITAATVVWRGGQPGFLALCVLAGVAIYAVGLSLWHGRAALD